MNIKEIFYDKLNVIRETYTQVTFECPVCSGHSLKMNKQSFAYCCFSSGCSPDEIRKTIGIKTGGVNKTNNKIITPVYVNKEKIDLHKVELSLPDNKKFYYHKYNQWAVKTEYIYDENHKMERIKLLSLQDKIFYPKENKNGKWEISSNNFPFFNANKITEKNKTILFAEGEKCASEVSRFALCLTAPGFGSNSYKFLSSNIEKIMFEIKNVVIFSDPDEIGHKKARLLQDICWEKYIPCSIIRVSDTLDIFDVIRKNNKFCYDDLLSLIIDHL